MGWMDQFFYPKRMVCFYQCGFETAFISELINYLSNGVIRSCTSRDPVGMYVDGKRKYKFVILKFFTTNEVELDMDFIKRIIKDPRVRFYLQEDIRETVTIKDCRLAQLYGVDKLLIFIMTMKWGYETVKFMIQEFEKDNTIFNDTLYNQRDYIRNPRILSHFMNVHPRPSQCVCNYKNLKAFIPYLLNSDNKHKIEIFEYYCRSLSIDTIKCIFIPLDKNMKLELIRLFCRENRTNSLFLELIDVMLAR